MKIYTSYFANHKKLREANIISLGIAIHPPKWFNGFTIFDLAPRMNMLRMKPDTYNRHFADILARTTPKAMLKEIKRFSRSDGDIALVCYEKDHCECHRKQVAEWFRKGGVDVEEFGLSKNPSVTQSEMF